MEVVLFGQFKGVHGVFWGEPASMTADSHLTRSEAAAGPKEVVKRVFGCFLVF